MPPPTRHSPTRRAEPMGSYVPNSPAVRQEMLAAMGASSIRDLYANVPEEMFVRELDLPAGAPGGENSGQLRFLHPRPLHRPGQGLLRKLHRDRKRPGVPPDPGPGGRAGSVGKCRSQRQLHDVEACQNLRHGVQWLVYARIRHDAGETPQGHRRQRHGHRQGPAGPRHPSPHHVLPPSSSTRR